MAGVPQIEVTFSIDANGIVNVTAKDLSTGKAQEITIESSSNMSDADIQEAIRDAQQYASEDGKFRRETELRRELQRLIAQADAVRKQAGEGKKRPLFRAPKDDLTEPVKTAEKALRGKDLEQMEAARAALEAALQNGREGG
jgi:molecular chaperone DnaK